VEVPLSGTLGHTADSLLHGLDLFLSSLSQKGFCPTQRQQTAALRDIKPAYVGSGS
jgi:hypothetical protein